VQFHWSKNPSIGAASVFVHFYRASRERAGAVTEGIVHQRVTARTSARLDACLEELFKRFAPPVVQSGRENWSVAARVGRTIRAPAAIFRSSGSAGPAEPTEPAAGGGLPWPAAGMPRGGAPDLLQVDDGELSRGAHYDQSPAGS